MKRIVLVLMSVFLLSACNLFQKAPEQSASTPIAQPAPTSVVDEDDMGEGLDDAKKSAYVDSTGDVAIAGAAIGNGDPALLFFYAVWCGYCQAKDATLTTMYEQSAFTRSTYKIDFDTASNLKATYGIATQDTVVLVDGAGEAIETVTGATQEDLRRLLEAEV